MPRSISYRKAECTVFSNMIADWIGKINNLVGSMGSNSGLLSTLDSWNASLYGYAQVISTDVIKPVAYTVLTLFLLLELYAASQRMAANGGGNTYGVQQIGYTMFKMVLCKLAVDYSFDIINTIYSVFAHITSGIAGKISGGAVTDSINAALIDTIGSGIGDQIGAFIAILIAWLIVQVVNLIVSTIVAARFIELYLYVAVAPLPLTTLTNQELHTVGVNFLKSFAAVSLQGALLYLVIGFYPALFNTLSYDLTSSLTAAAWGMAGYSLVLAVTVFSCGRIAKSICNAM